MAADVSEPGGAEERIAQCMDGDIPVRVGGKALIVLDLHTGQHERSYPVDGGL